MPRRQEHLDVRAGQQFTRSSEPPGDSVELTRTVPQRPTVSGDRATPAVANLSIPPGAGQVSGTASSDPVSAVAHPEHRATGTIVPDTAGQGRITPPVGGVSNLNPSSSPLGSTTSSASSTSSIPQSSTTTTVPTNQTAAAVPPQAGSATSGSPRGGGTRDRNVPDSEHCFIQSSLLLPRPMPVFRRRYLQAPRDR